MQTIDPEPLRAVDESLSALTEGQKACLRLVGTGMSSKEIALETGLSPMTVDTYVKAAMSRLGASNRRDAARILSRWEQSQNSGSPPAELSPLPIPRDSSTEASERGWPSWAALVPLGGEANTLGHAQRVYAILRVAGVSTVVVLAIMLLIAGLLRTFP